MIVKEVGNCISNEWPRKYIFFFKKELFEVFEGPFEAGILKVTKRELLKLLGLESWKILAILFETRY